MRSPKVPRGGSFGLYGPAGSRRGNRTRRAPGMSQDNRRMAERTAASGPVKPATADPTSVDSFLKTIVRSGLVTEERLRKTVSAAPSAARQSPQSVAGFLVHTGVLTRFQADKLLGGAERGLVLGPYHILTPVGRGGMGAVYLGRDSRDKRLVALTVLPPQKYREQERGLARFRREQRIRQRGLHPTISRDVG